MNSAIIFQIQSTLILILIYLGFFWRRNRTKHVRTMVTAIVWDVLLILQIELTRGAVEKAIKITTNKMLLTIHVGMALATVLLYIALLWSGWKLLKGDVRVRPRHRLFGYGAITLRTLTYITSFLVA